jgi:hypothetical protein
MLFKSQPISLCASVRLVGNQLIFPTTRTLLELSQEDKTEQRTLSITSVSSVFDGRELPLDELWKISDTAWHLGRRFVSLVFDGPSFTKRLKDLEQKRNGELYNALERLSSVAASDEQSRCYKAFLQQVADIRKKYPETFCDVVLRQAHELLDAFPRVIEAVVRQSREEDPYQRLYKAFIYGQAIALRVVLDDDVADGPDKCSQNVEELTAILQYKISPECGE